MSASILVRASDLRGAGRLAIDATTGVTDMVEAMHATIARHVSIPDTPVHAVTRGLTSLVYGSIRGVTRLVGAGIDLSLRRLEPLAGEGGTSAGREAALAVLNGVLGDHLEASGNPLAIPMRLRRNGQPLDPGPQMRRAIPDAGERLLVLAHGLCMNDLQWSRAGHDHAAALVRDLGYTAVHLHYNTGLHVSTNGRRFAVLLEELVRHWPVRLRELTIVAHSMGGLLARSAYHYGSERGHAWPRRLRRIVFLGTPHHGAPLERGGNWIDLLLALRPTTAPLARIGKVRSAGVTDLRHGSLLDEDWHGHDRFAVPHDRRRPIPLPAGVACYAVAATIRDRPASRVRRLPGDGLVPVNSALGRHRDRRHSLRIPVSQRAVVYATSHFDLLASPDVYLRIRNWLAT